MPLDPSRLHLDGTPLTRHPSSETSTAGHTIQKKSACQPFLPVHELNFNNFETLLVLLLGDLLIVFVMTLMTLLLLLGDLGLTTASSIWTQQSRLKQKR